MASINVRNGKLVIDFRYRNQRCREQTLMEDTPQNRRAIQKVLCKIEAEITLGTFNYASYFPKSPIVNKLQDLPEKILIGSANTMPKFKQFAQEWYDEMEVGWRHSHKITVLRLLNGRIMDWFGEMDVSLITKADVLKFRASLAKVERKDGKTISADYINKYMKILRMPLNEAADRFNFTSPFRGVKALKKPKTHIDPFTMEEVSLILSAVRADFKAYYTVRFFTGMRTAEIDGLKWKYVDFERRQILIRETVVLGRVEYTKTDGSQREIEMSQPVYDALKQQWQASGGKYEYVFVNGAGNPLEYGNVSRRVWHPLLRYLNLPHRKAYQTRHTAATLWLAAGENPEWIARQLGHTTTEMLFRVYSRYVPNLTRKDGSAFERLLAANLVTAKEALK
jgi:integrase